MRASLNKARQRYQQNYNVFIGKIENDSDEVKAHTNYIIIFILLDYELV